MNRSIANNLVVFFFRFGHEVHYAFSLSRMDWMNRMERLKWTRKWDFAPWESHAPGKKWQSHTSQSSQFNARHKLKVTQWTAYMKTRWLHHKDTLNAIERNSISSFWKSDKMFAGEKMTAILRPHWGWLRDNFGSHLETVTINSYRIFARLL